MCLGPSDIVALGRSIRDLKWIIWPFSSVFEAIHNGKLHVARGQGFLEDQSQAWRRDVGPGFKIRLHALGDVDSSALFLNRSVWGRGWVMWEGRQMTATPGDERSRISLNLRLPHVFPRLRYTIYFKYFLSIFGPAPAYLHVVGCEPPLDPRWWICDSRKSRST